MTRRAVAAAFALTLLTGVAGGRAAESPDREAELEEIRGQIAVLQARLDRVRRDQRTAANRLEQTRLELGLAETRVAEVTAARQLAEERLQVTEQRVTSLEADLDSVRSQLHRRVVALYRLGRGGTLRLAMSLDREADGVAAVRQLRYLARRDAATRDRFVEARVLLAMEQEQAVVERARVERLLAQEEQRRGQLAALQRSQAQALARVEGERNQLQVRADDLADKERKLASFLSFLYGRQRTPLSGTPIQGFRGVLDWPADGRVTQGFGPRTDPRYRTRTPHNGLEIATRPGEAVRAIYPGKVLFAAPFRGYGPTAIVHHAGGVFTLYAGLERLVVGEGRTVAVGEELGSAAASLYFEIRVDNKPEDPTSWLRRR